MKKRKLTGTLASLCVATMIVSCTTSAPYITKEPDVSQIVNKVRKLSVIDSKMGGKGEVNVNLNLKGLAPSFNIKAPVPVHGWNNIVSNIDHLDVRLYDQTDYGTDNDDTWDNAIAVASVSIPSGSISANTAVRFTGLLNGTNYYVLVRAYADIDRDLTPGEVINASDGTGNNGATSDPIGFGHVSGKMGTAGGTQGDAIQIDSNGNLTVFPDAGSNSIVDITLNLGMDLTAEVDGSININPGADADFGGSTEMVQGIAPPVPAPLGNNFVVNSYTSYGQGQPSVTADSDGDFVVVWQGYEYEYSGTWGVYAKVYNSDGSVRVPDFRVNDYTTGNQKFPKVAVDSDGDFVIVWEGEGTGDTAGIFAKKYNSTGVVTTAEFRVNDYTTGSQVKSDVAIDSDGDFVIVWGGEGTGDTAGVFAKKYDSTGVVTTAEFRVNNYTTNSQRASEVAIDSDGDFVVAWQSSGSYGDDSDSDSIQARRYDSNGNAKDANEFQVNDYTTNLQFGPGVGMDAAGDFVVTWSSYGQDGYAGGIYAKKYDSTGTETLAEVRINEATNDGQLLPKVAVDADGDFIIAWEDGYYYNDPADGYGGGVVTQRYSK